MGCLSTGYSSLDFLPISIPGCQWLRDLLSARGKQLEQFWRVTNHIKLTVEFEWRWSAKWRMKPVKPLWISILEA
jgi:hypothetical protein